MRARFDSSVMKRQTKSRSSSERERTKESFGRLVSGAAVSTIHRTVASSGPFAPPCICVNGQIGAFKVSALPCQLGRAYSCIHLRWVASVIRLRTLRVNRLDTTTSERACARYYPDPSSTELL